MRRVEESVLLPGAPAAVWGRLASPDFCRALAEAIGLSRRAKMEARDCGDGGSLRTGSELLFQKADGKAVMRWRVSECLPEKMLSLAASDHGQGLSSYDASFEFRLEPEGDGDRTRVRASMYLLLTKSAMELVSLLLPVRWIYARALRKALARLRPLS
jgi:hypothetical protein